MRQGSNRVLAAFGADGDAMRAHLTEVKLRAGQVLCEAGEEVQFVYFLHHGAVSKMTVFADGAEIEAALVGREGALGATAALGLSRSLTRDICHVDARASRIPVARLREACATSPSVREIVQRYALWKMASAIRSGACNASHPVGQRLCRWLLTCSDVLETGEITLSQDVFAKMLGVQRSSINPILQDLKAARALEIGRARIVIADRTVLLARACDCYTAMKRDQEMLLAEASHSPPARGQVRAGQL